MVYFVQKQIRIIKTFWQLTPGETLCASVELLRASEVAEVKPATLNAFDYYKPGNLHLFKMATVF